MIGNKIEIVFGIFRVVFEETIIASLYNPNVYYENKIYEVPLILESWQIEKVAYHLDKIEEKELPFDLFCKVVSGACLYAMKGSM